MVTSPLQRIVVVDDHDVVRRGLRHRAIRHIPDWIPIAQDAYISIGEGGRILEIGFWCRHNPSSTAALRMPERGSLSTEFVIKEGYSDMKRSWCRAAEHLQTLFSAAKKPAQR